MAIDGRTKLARRIFDIAEGFAHQLGGWASLSLAMIASIKRAAELSALAERTRDEALRKATYDPVSIARLEGAAERAVRALQLDVPRDPKPLPQSLDQWMAELSATSGQTHRAPQPPTRYGTPAPPENARVRPAQGKKRPPTGRPPTGRRAG
jgi:hypothetical protein